MKKYIFLFFVLTGFINSYAQEWRPLHVSHWSYLYKESNLSSSKIGVLATEASVKLLDSTKNFYKIMVENNDTGFIPKQKFTKTMRGRKDVDEPKTYFYRGTEG